MQRIGRYEIIEELGRGAMGVVFRAMDPVIGRTIAIKTIRLGEFPDPAEKAKLRERLFREARSAGVLSHPHIVTIYDIGEDGDNAFIAMEFVSGSTLDQILRRQEIDRETLLAVLADTAEALDYAHSKGIVHRDVKPGNIMLTDARVVKITDFGVAKILSAQATQSDFVLGTPSYMSPEQIEGNQSLDGRSDQFALAVIAYELLTGEKPFSAESLPALMLRICREPHPDPRRLNPTLDAPVREVFDKGLAKWPGERFATCTQFVRALGNALAQCPDWRPLPRGSAAALPTMETARDATRTASTLTRPVPPPADSSTARNLTRPLRRARELRDLEEPASHLGRNTVLAILALALLGAAAWATRGYWEPILAGLAGQEQATTVPPLSQGVPPPPEPSPTPGPAPSPAATGLETPPAPPPAPATPLRANEPRSGIVDIQSQPPGAQVTIDDTKDSCITPCSMELASGRHVLHFKLTGHRAGVAVILVPQESKAFTRLDPSTGTLLLLSTPDQADILVDGEPKGKTPLTLKLPIGRHRVIFRREGKPDQVREVELADEQIANLDVTWQ